MVLFYLVVADSFIFLFFSNKSFIFLILFYSLYLVIVLLLLACSFFLSFSVVVLFYLVVVLIIFLFFPTFFNLSNFILFFVIVLLLFFLFFCHAGWLAGSWFPGRGLGLSSCGGSAESKLWTNRETQTAGNINQSESSGGPHLCTKTRLYPTACKLQWWMPQAKNPVRQEYSPTHKKMR